MFSARESWNALSDIAELVEPESTKREDLINECKPGGRLNGVKAVYRTVSSASITGLWDAELVNALPKGLTFVSHNGAGYDQIDVKACSARDPPIRVSNTSGAVDDATADTAIFLLIGALRNFNSSMMALREGKWRGDPAPSFGHDPEGKTLGILGMGGIGRNMKKKLDAFDVKTIYYNRNRLPEDQEQGAKYVSFDELLAQSDILSLNLPLNVSSHLLSIERWIANSSAEKYPPHHLHERIRQNEERHCYHQHRSRCRYR